jgi:hypothetical protein
MVALFARNVALSASALRIFIGEKSSHVSDLAFVLDPTLSVQARTLMQTKAFSVQARAVWVSITSDFGKSMSFPRQFL